MRCDIRVCSWFVTGALTATTLIIFLLRVVPGTYVVLPCDPTITARPVVLDEYLDRLDLPPQQHLDLRSLHLDLQPQQVDMGHQQGNIPQQNVDLRHQQLDIGSQWLDLQPQQVDLGPRQVDLRPQRLDLLQEQKLRVSSAPQGLQFQLHQLLLRGQQHKDAAEGRQQQTQPLLQQQQQQHKLKGASHDNTPNRPQTLDLATKPSKINRAEKEPKNARENVPN